MKTEVAQLVNDDLRAAIAKLDNSVRVVMENCDEAEFTAYRRAVAIAMAPVSDVLAGLYRRNPEIKPPNEDWPS